MMTDRELLEAAAKAVGSDAWWSDAYGFMCLRSDGNRMWNPLTNEADLYRYARERKLAIDFDLECAITPDNVAYHFKDYPSEAHAILHAGLK